MGAAECAACGAIFERESNSRKYCDECQKRSSQWRTERNKERRAAREQAIQEAIKGRIRYDDFDLSGKSLARVDAEAKLFGMSYGQYTAAVRGGGIHQILKHKGIRNPKKMLRELEVR